MPARNLIGLIGSNMIIGRGVLLYQRAGDESVMSLMLSAGTLIAYLRALYHLRAFDKMRVLVRTLELSAIELLPLFSVQYLLAYVLYHCLSIGQVQHQHTLNEGMLEVDNG